MKAFLFSAYLLCLAIAAITSGGLSVEVSVCGRTWTAGRVDGAGFDLVNVRGSFPEWCPGRSGPPP